MNIAPRWKGKTAEAKALEEPMSVIVSKIQTSLIESNAQGLLSESAVLLEALPEQTELLYRACIGRPIITAEKDKQCVTDVLRNISAKDETCWSSSLPSLPSLDPRFSLGKQRSMSFLATVSNMEFSKSQGSASNMESFESQSLSSPSSVGECVKNWVVRAGSQYGVDYVAYCYHPAFVHSEYAVLALADEEGDGEMHETGKTAPLSLSLVWSIILSRRGLCLCPSSYIVIKDSNFVGCVARVAWLNRNQLFSLQSDWWSTG
ncbi:hypothetical protein SASPL_140965 [Salvia splendens]|uniref:tRNA-intron lyase n=1 Tax=Salvia splendens TaxID=180675 RepID=A0A8X8WRM5_SALSN|nr:hypothetical protein SASPL_140965 [Salvia splendens]